MPACGLPPCASAARRGCTDCSALASRARAASFWAPCTSDSAAPGSGGLSGSSSARGGSSRSGSASGGSRASPRLDIRRPQRRHVCAAAAGTNNDSSSAGSGSGGGGSTTGSNSSSSPRRQRTGLRREDLAFFIARSDLTWAQPWRFQQAAALSELQLRAQGLAALDDAAAADAGRSASASFVVQLPSGLGALVVAGGVEAAVPLRCEFCGDPFEVAVAERFDGVIHFEGASAALADAAARGGDASQVLGANELVFEAEANLVDITPLICDAILAALPTVCLCGGASCRQHAGRQVVWSSSPAAGAGGGAAASPFARLLAGGAQPKKKKGKGK
ncbi:hypothetical protein ABPG75_013090 [Micractinium tetrahymenae]